MTNMLAIIIYSTLAAVILTVTVSVLVSRKKHTFYKELLALSATLLGWLVTELLYFTLTNPAGIKYVFDLKLVFVSFMPLAVFWLMISFYRLSRFCPKYLFYVLAAVPVLTSVFALTTMWHGLLTAEIVVNAWPPDAGLTDISFRRGWWFYVHTAYSYGLLTALAVITIIQYINLPKAYRKAPLTMMLCYLLFIVGIVVEFGIDKGPLDFNLIITIFVYLVFYYSVTRQGSSDYLNVERSIIFDYLEQMVVVTDNDDEIMDINLAAKTTLEQLGYNGSASSYTEMAQTLLLSDKLTVKTFADGSTDLYRVNNGVPIISNVQRQTLLDEDGKKAGTVIVFSDVTRNRLFIERLQETAGIDKLTGLYNRYTFHALLRKTDTPENLPLSVIVGDLNGLKSVNDNYGHAEGDRFLTTVANVLRACCPESGSAARIGGDEFVILLPKCGAAGAAAVIDSVRRELLKIEAGYHMIIALGSATKHNPDENLNILIKDADMRMYDDKQWSQIQKPRQGGAAL